MRASDGITRSNQLVGSVRPSQLLYAYGVGAIVDLPNFSAVVSGIESWSRPAELEIDEPRLLSAVKAALGDRGYTLKRLGAMPRQEEGVASGPPSGVRVFPFPRWMRCPRCRRLAQYDAGIFTFKGNQYRPEEARFVHETCPRQGKSRRAPEVVPARFVLACRKGHLDEFPWIEFVHRGALCAEPNLEMLDVGSGTRSTDVVIACRNCKTAEGTPLSRRISDAFGESAQDVLPRCRGRHPHLRIFEAEVCDHPTRAMLLGASNAWFPISHSALALPRSRGSAVDAAVSERWSDLETLQSKGELTVILRLADFAALAEFGADLIWEAVERRREASAEEGQIGPLKAAEWQLFVSDSLPESPDFVAHDAGVPDRVGGLIARVVAVERLREVVALTGFTRIDPPDSGVVDDVVVANRVEISKEPPAWVPAIEVRGEGIFMRFAEDCVAEWDRRSGTDARMGALESAHAQRTSAPWPGRRYVLLHSFSHALINEFALECGYSAASLRERIYCAEPDSGDPMCGILIYTSAPDSEGTLGGLVSLADPDRFGALVMRALRRMELCGSDPLCAEHEPMVEDATLHGAACHACLFVPETSCERGNRYLDRATLVPTLAHDALAYFKV
ncbi:MAG: DrmB family protein [Candidatus Tyrphobacter sp.]